MEVQAVPVWQVVAVMTMLTWLRFARFSNLTLRLRSILHPLVADQVVKGTVTVLGIQSYKNRFLDVIFAVASSVVSVEFYTAFLPLLFWSGHDWLARQMTLLMALCIYVGNCVKDVVSAPRPQSPPVHRLTAIKCEEESAMEFGLPSSHTINTICLSMYLFTYFTKLHSQPDTVVWWLVLGIVCLVIFLVAFGRLYLGMHTPIDVFAGIPLGLFLLLLWSSVDGYVDRFILEGENVAPFWISLSILLLFAYPKAEHRTPSYEFHTAFNGVVLGVVLGSHRLNSFGGGISKVHTWSEIPHLAKRLGVGFPVVLAVKSLCKHLAVRCFPWICRVLNVPVRSPLYVPALQVKAGTVTSTKGDENRNLWLRILPSVDDDFLDVDTGIRVCQYAALGWSVAELVPCVFGYLGLR